LSSALIGFCLFAGKSLTRKFSIGKFGQKNSGMSLRVHYAKEH